MLAQLIVRNGEEVIFDNLETDDGKLISLNVAQYVDYNLSVDGLEFSNPVYARILSEAVEHSSDEGFSAEQYFVHHDDIEVSKVAADLSMDKYTLSNERAATADDAEKNADELRVERENHIDQLRSQTEHLLNDFRMDYLEQHLKDIQAQISQAVGNNELLMQLMEEYKRTHELRSKLARLLGNNIIA